MVGLSLFSAAEENWDEEDGAGLRERRWVRRYQGDMRVLWCVSRSRRVSGRNSSQVCILVDPLRVIFRRDSVIEVELTVRGGECGWIYR